jgi:hypothetical protein
MYIYTERQPTAIPPPHQKTQKTPPDRDWRRGAAQKKTPRRSEDMMQCAQGG